MVGNLMCSQAGALHRMCSRRRPSEVPCYADEMPLQTKEGLRG